MRLLTAVLLVAAAAPSAEIRYFAWERPVQLPQNATGQACLVLDTQTFAHASAGLADLRLYRGTDEAAYVIHYARPARVAAPTIDPVNLGRRDSKTVFDAAMTEGEYSDIALNITGQNFIATVTVLGSQAVAGPATRIGDYTIFDFADQKLGRSTVLHLPRSNYRYLHFEIAGPIAPDHVMNLMAAVAPPAEPKYLTIVKAGPFVQKGRTSVAEFSLPPHVPVDRIVFAPAAPQGNFSRDVELQALEIAPKRDDSAALAVPVMAGYGNLLRIHRVQEGHHIDEEQLALHPSQSAFSLPTLWTITVQNGDDVPVGFRSVEVQMLERDLCFEVAAGANYALYYGDKELFAPRYDYAAWFALQPSADLASLDPEQANPAHEARPDTRPFTEKHPALLWIALVVVVGLLGVVALRSARRVEPPASMP